MEAQVSLRSVARSDSPYDVEQNDTETEVVEAESAAKPQVVEAESAATPQTQSQPGAAYGTVATQSQPANLDFGG